DPVHRAQNLKPEAFVWRQNPSVGLEFAQRRQGHAEVHSGQRPPPHHALLPALRVRDFLNLLVRARIKGSQPNVPADIALRLGFGLEPRIAQLDANRPTAAGPEPVKDQARIYLGKMMISGLGGIGWMRGQFRLEAEFEA